MSGSFLLLLLQLLSRIKAAMGLFLGRTCHFPDFGPLLLLWFQIPDRLQRKKNLWLFPDSSKIAIYWLWNFCNCRKLSLVLWLFLFFFFWIFFWIIFECSFLWLLFFSHGYSSYYLLEEVKEFLRKYFLSLTILFPISCFPLRFDLYLSCFHVGGILRCLVSLGCCLIFKDGILKSLLQEAGLSIWASW